MVAPLPRLVEDIVGGLHFASGVPRPWERGRLRAYAYDALAFALDYFRWEVRPQSAPIFRVSHALLREREFDLPQKPDSARRGLEKIISEVRREQAVAPTSENPQAGRVCQAHPTIALLIHRRDRGNLARREDTGVQH